MTGLLIACSRLMSGAAMGFFLVALHPKLDTNYFEVAVHLLIVIAVLWALYGIYWLGTRHGKRGSDT
jgi:high-affinity Fe2+/Pb2+ permease